MNENLKTKLINKQAIISVIGLGYIGLPLALSFASAGYKVNGIDIDKTKITKLQNKQSYISDIEDIFLKKIIKNNNIKFFSDYNSITESDVIIVCVPTPLNKTKDPDISYIISATENISEFSINKKLISIESTVYPGATDEIILPILLKKSNLNIGQDFNLIFSPERMDPGQRKWNLKNTPKVIGGITPNCNKLGSILYKSVADEVITVSSTRAAEMTKLLENTFRAANIGLINEMAMICEKLNLDIWEIIEAAKSKPFGFMPFYPGPGLGGHCIPIDPRYLEWKLETLNSESKFIKLSEEINFGMPHYTLKKLKNIQNENKISNKSIIIFGVAYKPNVSDTRESPAIDLMKLLKDENISFKFNDPYVNSVEFDGDTYYSTDITKKVLNESGMGVIITNHSIYKWDEICNNLKYIFDTRNALQNTKSPKSKIYKL